MSIETALTSIYNRVLSRPWWMLLAVFLVTVLILPGGRYFTFDASADTLVVEGDPDLAFYEKVLSRFGGAEFMLMTLTPDDGDLLSKETLELVATLKEELIRIEGVSGVLSLLDAPLLKSPPVPVTELATGFKQLNSPGVDLELARTELLSSPLFRDLLISADGRSTALRIDLVDERELRMLREERNRLRKNASSRTPELAQAERNYADVRADFLQRRVSLVEDIRRVRDRYLDSATIYIGGVPMIASDMIEFIKDDIAVFGVVMVIVMLLVLCWFFRQAVWVVLPLASAVLTNLLVIGILGYAGQPATVVSSNFIALLGITSIALNIHLIVRYQELKKLKPDDSHQSLVLESIRSKFAPCVYTALTTMVAFGSLSSSEILPVEVFGWIMMLGIACSLIVIFTLFPALLLLFPPAGQPPENTLDQRIVEEFGEVSITRTRPLILLSGVIALITVVGVGRLSLDNRFIDYFRDGTDIREGLLFVDQNLGGTIPFDVIVQFPPWEPPEPFDEEDDFAVAEEDPFPQKYWFTQDKIARLGQLQEYIDNHFGVGKTLSLATLELVARDFTDGKPLSSLVMAAVLDTIPDSLRNEFISPFARPEDGWMRISGRIVESGPYFSRRQLIEDIESHAVNSLGFEQAEVRTTGMMVMFNNMLEQLLRSQTSTLVYVLLAVLVMFLLLLRDLRLSVIGLIPNILAPAAVLAALGYAGVPLNMLTVTVAAISIGIGVDDAIHYLHRYRIELAEHSPAEAIRRTHKGVGAAMYYTSVTVTVGFGVLSLSNFIPNVTFGLLTGLAMVFALLANLVLMPALLMLFYSKKSLRATCP